MDIIKKNLKYPSFQGPVCFVPDLYSRASVPDHNKGWENQLWHFDAWPSTKLLNFRITLKSLLVTLVADRAKPGAALQTPP